MSSPRVAAHLSGPVINALEFIGELLKTGIGHRPLLSSLSRGDNSAIEERIAGEIFAAIVARNLLKGEMGDLFHKFFAALWRIEILSRSRIDRRADSRATQDYCSDDQSRNPKRRGDHEGRNKGSHC